MTTNETTQDLPEDITAGDVLVELSAAPTAAGASSWIKIAPRGKVTTRLSVPYDFDPEALAARFTADDVKIAIDFDHAIAKLASLGQQVDAIGWIEELQARDDGLYGRVEWLDKGKAALSARTHRYVSPTFHHEDGKATWIHSVALVTAPALSRMPALAHAFKSPSETSMTKKIATALGLAETADEAACLSAIGKLGTAKISAGDAPPEGYVTLAVHTTTLATLSATKKELDDIKSAGRQQQVDTLLDGALKTMKILPAQKAHYASLCATDQGLEQVTALLAATAEGLRPSGLDGKKPDAGQAAGDGDAVNPVALAAEARTLVTAAAAAGNHLTIQEAVAQVQAKKGAAA